MCRGRLVAVALMVAGVAAGQAPEEAARRFVQAYVAYAPESSVDIRVNSRGSTPAGPYLVATALRSSLRGGEPEQLSLLIDPESKHVTVGPLIPLPPTTPPLTPGSIPEYVETALPQLLSGALAARVKMRWPSTPARPTAVVVLAAEVATGYGWMRMPGAITMDGKYFMLGATWPLERDPRTVRREILRDAPVRWDPGHETAMVQLVEFSDFQCPACKYHWTTVKEVLSKAGPSVRHGMVNYPLTQSHPWAFAAAVAGECIGRVWPERFLGLKEEFYRLQDSMSVETVKDAALGFLSQQGLADKPFTDCFMKDPVVEAVLRQIDLAQRLGVIGTPTYFANGEILAAGNKEWMLKRLQAIVAAKGLPENAAEIRPDPTPSGAPTQHVAVPGKRPVPPAPTRRATTSPTAPAPSGADPGPRSR